MKKLLLSFLPILFVFSIAEAQTWAWGKSLAISADPAANCVAADSKGNAYLGGTNNNNSFLVKYDSLGNTLWSQYSTGTGNYFWGSGVVATDDSGNIYLGGGFSGTASFGTIVLTSSTLSESTFLIKYNSAGTPLWGATSWDRMAKNAQINGIVTDDSANVYITGYFMDSVGFGPFKFANTSGSSQLFVVKYNSAGKVKWAKVSSGGAYNLSYAQGHGISHNTSGLYVAGDFNDTLFMGNDTLTSIHNPGVFVIRLDYSGHSIWGRTGQVTNSFSGKGSIYVESVVSDRQAHTYVTGYFIDTVNLAGVVMAASCPGVNIGYLAKLDSTGKAIWVKTASCNWMTYQLAIDTNNIIYVSGGTYPGGDSVAFCGRTLNISGAKDAAFFMKLDTAGNSIDGAIIRTGGDDYNGIASTPDGKYVFVGGDIFDTITFYKDFLDNHSTEEPFIASWGKPSKFAGVQQLHDTKGWVSVYPNPNKGRFNLVMGVEKESGVVEVYNALGQQVYSQSVKGNESQFNIDLGTKSPGIYLYRVINQSGQLLGTGKFVIE